FSVITDKPVESSWLEGWPPWPPLLAKADCADENAFEMMAGVSGRCWDSGRGRPYKVPMNW
ncbi:MAG TPA: hypothetical protein VFV34_09850, partial [Blastocatellia bacterium]|nr:hypothetical protein [Blastocatellia bacterium]